MGLTRERGQATIEWVGLVLALALAFGGALGAARGAGFGTDAHGLGDAVAGRMTCAVRDACGARPAAGGVGGLSRVPGPPSRLPPRSPPPPPSRAPEVRPPPLRFLRGVRPPPGSGTAVGVGRRALRVLGRVGERSWLLCLGYRSIRHDIEHPRTPNQALPARDALDIVNRCLTPLGGLLR